MKPKPKIVKWLPRVILACLVAAMLILAVDAAYSQTPVPPIYLPLIVLDPSATPTLTFTPTFTITPTISPTPTFTPTPTNTPVAIIYLPIISGRHIPLHSTSYYIQNEAPREMYELGCRLGLRDQNTPGKQDSIVILAFGQMWIENGVYGVGKFGDYWRFTPLSAVNTAVREYIRGYWICSGTDHESQLTVGVGVNNYGRMNTGSTDQNVLRSAAYEFGKRFADLVHDVNLYAIQTGISSQVYVAAANDIEWDSTGRWQSSYVTRGWVDGFRERDRGVHIYFNFGACAGCPTDITPSNVNWRYPTGNWTLDDIWYVSWGAPPAYTLPEIYLTDGWNARQWYAISKYAALYKGGRIDYVGPMTQYGACQVRTSDRWCSMGLTNNTPDQGWTQLFNELNKDPLTAQNILRWVTDITWQIR